MEYHSVHSAPDSRMNRMEVYVHSAIWSRMKRMEGIRFTLNRQNTRSFGKFWREILRGRSRADIVVLRSPPQWVFRSVLFEIEISCIL